MDGTTTHRKDEEEDKENQQKRLRPGRNGAYWKNSVDLHIVAKLIVIIFRIFFILFKCY